MNLTSRLFAHDNLFWDSPLCLPSGDLYQVSELSVVRDGEIPEHIQICDEITYVISGKARFYSGGRCQLLSGGQVHYVRKGVSHRIQAEKEENLHYLCIGFVPEQGCGEIAAFLQETEEVDSLVLSDDGSIRTLGERLLHEFYLGDDQSKTMIHLYLVQLMISLCRLHRGTPKARTAEKSGASASHYAVYQTLRYIDRNYLTITSIRQLAGELSYSEYYLSHLFRSRMGITIKEYITRKKISGAARLLRSGDMEVREIAEQMGFASPHSFRQAFHRCMGMSPSAFRSLDPEEQKKAEAAIS